MVNLGGLFQSGLLIQKSFKNGKKLLAPEISFMYCAFHTDKAYIGAAFLQALYQFCALGKSTAVSASPWAIRKGTKDLPSCT